MQLKQQYTIGCCGIDCGLCPRFHTNGPSACPGCGGPDFHEKHPSCGFVTCCVKKRGLEECSDCKDFPCSRFESEKNGFDSFVTHKRVFPNLDFIKAFGMELFLDQQKLRMNVLNDFIANFDDGRSKSFYCLSCALLPVDKLLEAQRFMVSQKGILQDTCKMLHAFLQEAAEESGVELKLKNKGS